MSLTEQQQQIMSDLEKGLNVFATGPAGTGKSFLIRHIYDVFPKRTTQICSMTGVSTVLLNNLIQHSKAKTLHSWSGIGLCQTSKDRIFKRIMRNTRCLKRWQTTQLLIVDEVSMMSRYIFELLEEFARYIRRNDLPFGGLQIVFTGDMFQLPPVACSGTEDTGAFCFESPRWNVVFGENYGTLISLTRVFRQEGDEEYRNVLNEVRLGQCSEESWKLLKSRVVVEKPEDAIMTKLFPTRMLVQQLNESEYGKIEGEEFVYEIIVKTNHTMYIDDGEPFDEYDRALCLETPLEEKQKESMHFKSVLPCVDHLRLKKGVIVMCLVNEDIEKGIVNGSQGRVVDFHLGSPLVEFTNGEKMVISVHYWQNGTLPCILVGQIPLVLSWATTIHKSQGMTLSRAEIDLGNQIFEYGQAYVALSRVKSSDGLYLTKFNPYKIKANPKVLKFYQSLNSLEEGYSI